MGQIDNINVWSYKRDKYNIRFLEKRDQRIIEYFTSLRLLRYIASFMNRIRYYTKRQTLNTNS
jgi:hypothetical protein